MHLGIRANAVFMVRKLVARSDWAEIFLRSCSSRIAAVEASDSVESLLGVWPLLLVVGGMTEVVGLDQPGECQTDTAIL